MQSIVADRIRLDEDADGSVLSCRVSGDGLDLPAELLASSQRIMGNFHAWSELRDRTASTTAERSPR